MAGALLLATLSTALPSFASPVPEMGQPDGSGGDATPGSAALLSPLAEAIHALVTRPEPARVSGGQEELQRFYESGAYAPLWLDSEGRPARLVQAALTLLRESHADGLQPAEYRADELAAEAARLQTAEAADARALAGFEVELSRQMLRYLRQLHLGRVDPRVLGFKLPAVAQAPDFPALLRHAIATQGLAKLAESLAPPSEQYRSLRSSLASYRRLAAGSELPRLPSSRKVAPGQPYPGAQALHRRLIVLGDLPAGTPPPASAHYSGPLVEGVRRFQTRHGLQPDGVLGRSTLAALNVPLAARVRQIELAMERLRWLPRPDGRPFLAVNIPMFRLAAWEAESAQRPSSLRMRVIVGRARETQTPVMFDEMRYLVFRPYWNVPQSIVRDEILPALERDPQHLAAQGMELVQGGGDDAARVAATPENIERLRQGKLRLRQRPGPHNSLGLAKFIFPNDEAVYLHGTPAKRLFKRARRDFSHGCVRVEDPVALAEWLLKDQPQWTRARIDAAMRGSRPVKVDLAQPVPVLLYYLTASVMPHDGTIHFAQDIYGHDRKLEQALAKARTI